MGFLSGGGIDRYIVQFPAWRHLDILSWAQYGRHADLANGLFLYPFEAIGSFLLLPASSIIIVTHPATLKQTALMVHLATLFAAIGLILTLFAAPVMLSLKTIGNDEVILRNAFDKFYFWSLYRLIAQVLSFCFCVLAMGNAFITNSNS